MEEREGGRVLKGRGRRRREGGEISESYRGEGRGRERRKFDR